MMSKYFFRYELVFSAIPIIFWTFLFAMSFQHSEAMELGVLDFPTVIVIWFLTKTFNFGINGMLLTYLVSLAVSLSYWSFIALVFSFIHYRAKLIKKGIR